MKFIPVFLLFLLPFPVFAQDQNPFQSATIGFKITKPDDWEFFSAEQNLNNMKNVKLSDNEFHQLMMKYSNAPFVAMMKHPEPFDDLNPSLKINIKPLGQFKGTDPKHILGFFVPQFQKIFQDFKLVQPPMDTKLGGLAAAYMRINFTLAISDGRSFPATSELWIVPRGDYFFMIGAGTRQDEETGSREEIAEILSSMVL
ncbi:MAG: hypothetical protein JXB25_13170 [Deltaproteobacteria bacterium]|nr:hypothetical protein [Deltaproteobacteria bacterium]